MVSLMNRSIDLLEALARESDNVFHLNRRGYVYVTADAGRIPWLRRAAFEAERLGAGTVRIHADAASDYQPAPAAGFEDQPTGADMILEPALIQKHFPYLSAQTVAVLHARRCGWFSAQQLGMYMLERARSQGAQLITARVTDV